MRLIYWNESLDEFTLLERDFNELIVLLTNVNVVCSVHAHAKQPEIYKSIRKDSFVKSTRTFHATLHCFAS